MNFSRTVFWVAWRQQRFQVLVGLLSLGCLAGGLLLFRNAVDASVGDLGLSGCGTPPSQKCNPIAIGELVERYGGLANGSTLALLATPPLFGALSGAPLFAREYENGTQVLALSQSVSVVRWWSTKFAIAAVPIALGMLVVGVVSQVAFNSTYGVASIDIITPGFETRGLVPCAYFLLAFSVGATVGVYVRNTAAAVGLAVVVYAVLLLMVGGVIRPHYLAPQKMRVPLAEAIEGGPAADDWVLSEEFADSGGNPVMASLSTCGNESLSECFSEQGVAYEQFVYYPASTFWTLQGIESLVLLCACACIFAVGLVRLLVRVI